MNKKEQEILGRLDGIRDKMNKSFSRELDILERDMDRARNRDIKFGQDVLSSIREHKESNINNRWMLKQTLLSIASGVITFAIVIWAINN